MDPLRSIRNGFANGGPPRTEEISAQSAEPNPSLSGTIRAEEACLTPPDVLTELHTKRIRERVQHPFSFICRMDL